MIDKALAFIFWVSTVAVCSFIIAFVFIMFYLLTLAIMSVFYLLQ